MKKKNLAFTLAEVLIVIGIIGVVAALTLPNLNHATGDKETVTRLKKAYSILNEANDRAVAIYGPISTWSEECLDNIEYCWMRRIGEFLKIAKSCDETGDSDSDSYVSCDSLEKGDMNQGRPIMYQLTDGISFVPASAQDCKASVGSFGDDYYVSDACIDEFYVDINGPTKGKNEMGYDVFDFVVSDSLGIVPYAPSGVVNCINEFSHCAAWILEHDNVDYLKGDNGECPNGVQLGDGVYSCN